jgi:hypothetical protein
MKVAPVVLALHGYEMLELGEMDRLNQINYYLKNKK